MNKTYRFYIVDDDPITVELLTRYLKNAGQSVTSNTSSTKALNEIKQMKPDCVLVDIIMPGIDGLELLKRLKKTPGLENMKIIIVSGKTYEFDRKRAFSFGADAYITKPVSSDDIVKRILEVIDDRVKLSFWGVRGTLPVPGEDTVRYGGNTSCVTLSFPQGHFFIFDAGTGIKVLSDHLKTIPHFQLDTKIFISHPHWDHINALPFFAPLFVQGNEFEICGASHSDVTMRELISAQMDGVYFPINIKEFGARTYFRDLQEEEFYLKETKIKTILLNHPGYCLGYRVEYKDRSVCYVTDNELFPENSKFYNENYAKRLASFIQNTDALVTDCTYSDAEYELKMGFGHSSVGQVVNFAAKANVKTLYLFHHDPDQSDDDIDEKLIKAQEIIKDIGSEMACIAPKEKQSFKI